MPDDVLAPASYAELADLLARATAGKRAVKILGRGAGVRIASRATTTLQRISLTRLPAVIDHAPGDLVAVLSAGIPLDEANRELERSGQRLPIDPFDAGTLSIGGLVAANASGPRRHRFGTPRDLIIGVEMMLADGRIARAGGRVVKNVAGYDLPRMLCGSYGTLAIVLSATFKLSPAPRVSQTAVIELPDAVAAAALTRAIGSAPLTPSAVELVAPGWTLLIRFESTPTAVARQIDGLLALCDPGVRERAQILADAAEADAWSSHRTRIVAEPGTVLRAGVLPTGVWPLLDQVQQQSEAAGVAWHVAARVALGAVDITLRGASATHSSIVTALRASLGDRGHVIVARREDDEAAADVDTWGDAGDTLALMRAVKARFDPAGILNPGGGPFGI
jgi:glycolate oxidase FAD binding subunit